MAETASNLIPCILILESQEPIGKYVSDDLQEVGYETILTNNADIAFQQTFERSPAMVIIDRGLDNESALVFCERLRQKGSRIPVLLMMNRDGVDDRVICLEVGADDYFLKQPYRSDALIKMVQFYLKTEVTTQEQLRFGDLVLDLGTRQVLRNGKTIDLTMKEFELLKYMMEHPRDVLSREQILENVWGFDYVGESNVIEVYIRYLRLKIEEEGGKRLIQTVRGIGYVLREN
ncbi:response regulator transcription factor [filamentous cyanobacterium LEGE 11480]|uniref:Response regulator transcription factor n=2 Tax=Romeriopsis TaxID=2992131 RepID=A0A928VU73_9CYAN|nr:response regulator transcription factor [Romeriopsis navalis LEGE 11480]